MTIRRSLKAQFELQVGIENQLAIVTETGQSSIIHKTYVERLLDSLGLFWVWILGKR